MIVDFVLFVFREGFCCPRAAADVQGVGHCQQDFAHAFEERRKQVFLEFFVAAFRPGNQFDSKAPDVVFDDDLEHLALQDEAFAGFFIVVCNFKAGIAVAHGLSEVVQPEIVSGLRQRKVQFVVVEFRSRDEMFRTNIVRVVLMVILVDGVVMNVVKSVTAGDVDIVLIHPWAPPLLVFDFG